MGRSWQTYQAERKATKLRQLLGLEVHEPFDPFQLASKLQVAVVNPRDIPNISATSLSCVLREDHAAWSAGTVRLADGGVVVILNPTHSRLRNKSTLMEEICHVILGHEPTKISVIDAANIAFRSWDKVQEEEAYRVGSAALVPYEALRGMIYASLTIPQIAKHFHVTQDLVEFRIKVNGLWKKYSRLHGP